MNRRGVTLPRTCANCAHYEQREVGRKEARKIRRTKRRNNGGHRFEMAVPQFQHSAPMVAEQPQMNAGALQPGAHREIMQNRAETLGDVGTYAGKGALIAVAGLCGGAVLVLLWPELPDVRTLAVSTLASGALGILVSIYNPQEWLVGKLEEWLDKDIDGDGQVGTVVYPVRGVLDDGKGHQLMLGFDLEGPSANLMWHQFCKAVTYGGANFSETEATTRQGITPEDWKRILQSFVAQQWLQPAGPRGTNKLINEGPQWVKLYADNPPHPDGHGLSGRLYGGRQIVDR